MGGVSRLTRKPFVGVVQAARLLGRSALPARLPARPPAPWLAARLEAEGCVT